MECQRTRRISLVRSCHEPNSSNARVARLDVAWSFGTAGVGGRAASVIIHDSADRGRDDAVEEIPISFRCLPYRDDDGELDIRAGVCTAGNRVSDR